GRGTIPADLPKSTPLRYKARMLRLLLAAAPDRSQVVGRLVHRASVGAGDVEHAVRAVIDEVRQRGDEAVRAFTERWEKRELEDLELPRLEWERLANQVAPDVQAAIATARERIARFHEKQRVEGYRTV